VIEARSGAGDHVVVCLPDTPGRRLMGELPANVEVLLVPPGPGRLPDLSRVDLIVPADWMEQPLLDVLGTLGRLQVIQTLSAGVDSLAGRVPEGVIVCNARGVYDAPVAEWVVGAILAVQRGLVRARDAQTEGAWTRLEPEELAGHRVVILGFGSIGMALAERLRPFGVGVVGVSRTRRDGVLGLADLVDVLPGAEILVDLLPHTRETVGFLDARRLGLLPDGALVVNAGRGGTVETPASARIGAPSGPVGSRRTHPLRCERQDRYAVRHGQAASEGPPRRGHRHPRRHHRRGRSGSSPSLLERAGPVLTSRIRHSVQGIGAPWRGGGRWPLVRPPGNGHRDPLSECAWRRSPTDE
jgi:lactate dehydrogenase-like 2-hydroxyacid dehydrogenase